MKPPVTLLLLILLSFFSSCEKFERVDFVEVFTLPDRPLVTRNSAILKGRLIGLLENSTAVIEYGHVFSADTMSLPELNISEKAVNPNIPGQNGDFFSNLENLLSNTTYIYRAYAIVDKMDGSQEPIYGEEAFQFFTPSFKIFTEEDPIEDGISATVIGRLEDIDGLPIDFIGHLWSTDSTNFRIGSACNNCFFTQLPPIQNDGIYTSEFHDLPVKSTIFYRAYALINGKYIYGETKSFSTTDQSDFWQERTTFLGGNRSGAIGFSDGTFGYIGFGRLDDGTFPQDLFRFDPQTNNWEEVAMAGNLPPGRESAMYVEDGPFIYLGLGRNSSGLRNDLWRYHIENNTWTNLGTPSITVDMLQMPIQARHSAYSFIVNNRLYIGGGTAEDGTTIFKDLWRSSDLSTDPISWEANSMEDFDIEIIDGGGQVIGITNTFERSGAYGFSHNNRGYIILGLQDGEVIEFDPPNNLSDIVICNPQLDLPVPERREATIFNIGNNLFLGGGVNLDNNALLQWFRLSPSNSGCQPFDQDEITNCGVNGITGSVGFTINGRGYIGTGSTQEAIGGSSFFYVYIPE